MDGNIVTSQQGLHYNLDNCEAVAAAMQSNLAVDPDAPVAEALTVSYEVAERNTSWTRTFGGSSADGVQAMQQTSDGGFILAGYTFSFGHGYANGYLVRTDAAGNLIWSNAYGGAGWEYLLAVAETADGGFVAAGYTTSSGRRRDGYVPAAGGRAGQPAVGAHLWRGWDRCGSGCSG